MIFLSIEQLLQLHVLAIQRYGGSVGVRDIGRLESVLAAQEQAVFGEQLHKSVEEKAAVLMRNIIADHPFTDGNKRTGTLAALTFLELNDRVFVADHGQVEDFAVQIAVEHLEIEAIAEWLRIHTQ